MIILKPRILKPQLTPAQEVHSNYKCSKAWLADALMCHCVFPPLRMRETLFGYRCQNDKCGDFISKRDAQHIPRTKMDTSSVKNYMRSSSIMRQVKDAERTGNYLRAYGNGE